MPHRSQSPTTPVQIINEAMKFPPGAAPGTRFSYSNTNYVLLGLIVERISGIPLHAYYRKYIFRPAGMSETFAGTVPSRSPVATGYLLSDGGTAPQTPGDVSWYYGCGDALSTAADMARFDIALMNGRLVRASTLSAMTASAQPSDDLGRGTRYGLGFTIFPFDDLVSVGHHGGLPGFEAVAWVGLFTTAGTPAEIVGRLNADVNRIIHLPGIAMKFDEQGMTPAGGSATEFGAFISGELRRWKDAARAANVSAE